MDESVSEALHRMERRFREELALRDRQIARLESLLEETNRQLLRQLPSEPARKKLRRANPRPLVFAAAALLLILSVSALVGTRFWAASDPTRTRPATPKPAAVRLPAFSPHPPASGIVILPEQAKQPRVVLQSTSAVSPAREEKKTARRSDGEPSSSPASASRSADVPVSGTSAAHRRHLRRHRRHHRYSAPAESPPAEPLYVPETETPEPDGLQTDSGHARRTASSAASQQTPSDGSGEADDGGSGPSRGEPIDSSD